MDPTARQHWCEISAVTSEYHKLKQSQTHSPPIPAKSLQPLNLLVVKQALHTAAGQTIAFLFLTL